MTECDVQYTSGAFKDLLQGGCTHRYYLAGMRVDQTRDIRDSKWDTTRKFPFGEDSLTSGAYTEDDHFASYRSAGSGAAVDYARNRSYAPTLGTFTSPDPYEASGGAGDPGSWNRFAYVQGDPVGRGDRFGLVWRDRVDCWDRPGSEQDRMCWEFPWWEPDPGGPAQPEPDPPTLPAETSCSIETIRSGKPLLGQGFKGTANQDLEVESLLNSPA